MQPMSARMTGDELATRADDQIAESRFSGVVRIETPVKRSCNAPRAGLTGPRALDG
jgi:hypothetical protein